MVVTTVGEGVVVGFVEVGGVVGVEKSVDVVREREEVGDVVDEVDCVLELVLSTTTIDESGVVGGSEAELK